MSANRVPLVLSEELRQSWRNRSLDIDTGALGAELRRTASGEVRFDAGSKALYATDGSNYRQVPIGVVIPKSKQDGGTMLQRRCGRRLVEVPPPHR